MVFIYITDVNTKRASPLPFSRGKDTHSIIRITYKNETSSCYLDAHTYPVKTEII